MKKDNIGDILGIVDGYMDAGYVEGIEEYWTQAGPHKAESKLGFDVEAKGGRGRIPVRVIVQRR